MKESVFFVNDKKFNLTESISQLTILQACSTYSVDIPRFCYHDSLTIAGNCRMCLVQINNIQKPVAACAISISKDLHIYTNTFAIMKSRETVLEYLLANHPLDCPICDQAGECDLQDQSYIFGSDKGRFYEDKRTVIDKDCGPFIKTVMTRCIHCTKCVRFYNEIVGVNSLGVLGRGNNMEISFYIQNFLHSEISGNLSDICPVGAILTKTESFQKRSWELFYISSFDLFDTFGSLIRIDVIGTNIMRILPRYNLYINEEWITDRVRFFYDGLIRNRLISPSILENSKNNSKYIHVFSWSYCFTLLKKTFFFLFRNISLTFLINVGPIVETENLLIIKEFFEFLGIKSVINFQKNSKTFLNSDFCFPFFVDSLTIFNNQQFVILFGLDLRLQMPLLALKLRKAFLNNGLKLVVFSNITSLNFFYKNLGYSIKTLFSIFEGRNIICKYFNLYSYKKTMFIFGENFTNQFSGNLQFIINNKFQNLKLNCKFFNLLTTSTLLNSVEIDSFSNNYFDLNETNTLVFNHLVDIHSKSTNFSKILTINQNSHILENESLSETIRKTRLNLPCSTFIEIEGIFFNLEGKLLKTNKVFLLKKITVLKASLFFQIFSEILGFHYFYKTMLAVRRRLTIINPNFNDFFSINLFSNPGRFFGQTINSENIYNKNFITIRNSFYFNKNLNPYIMDAVSKSSKFLKKAYKTLFLNNINNFWNKY